MDPPPEDLLSSLPEHLLDEILRRLDLRDAMRTSAISRAWRRRWETIFGLALSFPKGTPPSVVDRVLLRYTGRSVSRFACYVDDSYADSEDDDSDADWEDDDYDYDASASASNIDDWLIALSRRRVKSMSILKCGERILTLHSSIFSCRRLVSLNLKSCSIPPLPAAGGFAGFPVLWKLYLHSVHFAENGESQLQAIIRASPRLRVLWLDQVCTSDMDRVIEAPNLHTLGLVCSSYDDWRFRELPPLQYASINLPGYLQQELLAGVSQVQKLIVQLPIFDFKMDAIPFTFYNLKSLELSTDFSEMNHILSMFCLLRSSPNLERLKIKVQWLKMVANQEFLNAQWTDGMCANLQDVQMTSYRGWLPLSFIELILSKASRLRILSVDACPVSQDDPLNELLNCRRASPQAQVLFKGK